MDVVEWMDGSLGVVRYRAPYGANKIMKSGFDGLALFKVRYGAPHGANKKIMKSGFDGLVLFKDHEIRFANTRACPLQRSRFQKRILSTQSFALLSLIRTQKCCFGQENYCRIFS